MKRKTIPLIILLSSFVLFGCGLTNLVNTNANVESPPVTTPENNPSETMEEDPEPAPTENVSAPEPTPTEETAASEPDPASENACTHPYFPISDGASWTYDDSLGEGYTMTLNEVEENAFTMTQEMQDSDTVFTVDWYCSDEGILRGTFGQVDMLAESTGEEDPEIVFETLEWEGETLPDIDHWEIGYAWTSKYILSGEVDMEGITATMDITVSIDHTLAAVEEVTVPAGTFPEAYRVDSVGQIDMAMVMGETTTPISDFPFNYQTWYVENLGMVKTGSRFQGYDTSSELLDSNLLPLE